MATELKMQEFKELIASIVKAELDSRGLTKVDRRYQVVPSTDAIMRDQALDPAKIEEIANFFRGLIMPEARFQKMTLDGGRGEIGEYWRDLSVATPEAGGYLVPTEFRAEVIQAMVKMPIMRNLCFVMPISAKEEIPRLTAKPTASWNTENTDFGDSEPAFDNITLSTNQLSVFVPMSRKFAANSRINIVQLLTQLFAETFGTCEDTAFMNGDGVNKPLGLRRTTGATAVVQEGATLAGDDLINLYHALPSQYRRNAVWFMPDSVIAKVRKLKQTTTGDYLWTTGLAGQPATILGRPVYEQNDIPTNLGSASPAVESEIWFGDPRYYYIGDNESMAVEATTTGGTAFRKHQLHIKAWEEIDGRCALIGAFRYLSGVK